VSLNVTGHELADPEFATRFLSEMARHGVLPSQVEVEVTEGVVMGDLDSCPVRQLARLQAAGVQVALDDFGTGFASLTHLRSVPIAALKIDRSFVTQVCCSQRDAAIIDGIAMIGQALGLTIVVEGVESAAQAAKVRELGCDTMQGYLGGRPQDGAATEQLIRSWPGQQHRIDALIQDAGTSSRLRAHRAARHR
jgi:EAL domain-containing protein (putative c-di-GMP-specific phosphodiesterase class I)